MTNVADINDAIDMEGNVLHVGDKIAFCTTSTGTGNLRVGHVKRITRETRTYSWNGTTKQAEYVKILCQNQAKNGKSTWKSEKEVVRILP